MWLVEYVRQAYLSYLEFSPSLSDVDGVEEMQSAYFRGGEIREPTIGMLRYIIIQVVLYLGFHI